MKKAKEELNSFFFLCRRKGQADAVLTRANGWGLFYRLCFPLSLFIQSTGTSARHPHSARYRYRYRYRYMYIHIRWYS